MCTRPRACHSHALWGCPGGNTKRASHPWQHLIGKCSLPMFKEHVQLSCQTDLGVIVKELEEQAELLNEFFDTVVRPDSGQPIPILPIPSAMMGNQILLLASSIKSSPLSSPQRAQALANYTLSYWSGWPHSSRSPWEIYLTPLRQWSVQYSRMWTQKTLSTTAQ